ncbi:unnamed protein product [Paramecium sonneborni]|uniref:non-specific serine/threonine protein kinase n=1 Tax=Paramecium sonneborni TaxID=65129 RepID=A0A8S1Q3G3_9CILI|nr:unnamed protein product [Paramecium sonneborni]
MKQRPTTAKVPKTIDQREIQQLHDLDCRQYQLIGSNLSHFTILNELGKGSYGVVYKVKSSQDGNIYVLKKINLTHLKSKHQAEALKEAQLLRKLKHPNIITYYMSFIEQDNLCIIMEYAEGGDLQKLLKDYKERRKFMQEETIWEMSRELSSALQHLHENNIIHRDIKTLNVFLTKEKHVKLGDLGVSKIFNSDTALQGTRVGTPLYLSPELVQHQPYDYKVDIWALGCVVFYMAALEPPFQGENLIALGYSIVNRAPKGLPPQYSTRLSQFIWKLLEKIPALRPSIQEVNTIYFQQRSQGQRISQQYDDGLPQMQYQQPQQQQRPQTSNPKTYAMQAQETEKMKKTRKPQQQDLISNGSDTIYMGDVIEMTQKQIENEQISRAQQYQQLLKDQQEKLEKERLERERIDRERQERMDRERQERLEKERLDRLERQERVEKEKMQRLERERQQKDLQEQERLKQIEQQEYKYNQQQQQQQQVIKIQSNQVELYIQDIDDKQFQEERKNSFSLEQPPKFKLEIKSNKPQNTYKSNVQIRPLSAQARGSSFANISCRAKLIPVQQNQSVKEVKKFTILDLNPNSNQLSMHQDIPIQQEPYIKYPNTNNNSQNTVINNVNNIVNNQPHKTKENIRIKSALILQYSNKRQQQDQQSNQIVKHYTLKDLVES